MTKAQFVTVQSISPQQLFLAREEEAKVRIVGGKSPYKVTVTAGAAQSTGNEIDWIYLLASVTACVSTGNPDFSRRRRFWEKTLDCHECLVHEEPIE